MARFLLMTVVCDFCSAHYAYHTKFVPYYMKFLRHFNFPNFEWDLIVVNFVSKKKYAKIYSLSKFACFFPA